MMTAQQGIDSDSRRDPGTPGFLVKHPRLTFLGGSVMAVAVLLALEAIFYVINAKGSKSRLKRGGFSRTTGEDAFRETFRSDDFYVLFFPEGTFYGRDMQGHLSAAGVRMRD